ncbi:MAG: DUF3098 domain-containing protein [Candidatus Cryptobacteroides sp.]
MKKHNDNTRMATTRKGLWMLLMGLIVMVSGFILMMGGAPEDPEVFNWSIFDFRRLVAAPLVIIAGLVVMIAAIMHRPSSDEKEDGK